MSPGDADVSPGDADVPARDPAVGADASRGQYFCGVGFKYVFFGKQHPNTVLPSRDPRDPLRSLVPHGVGHPSRLAGMCLDPQHLAPQGRGARGQEIKAARSPLGCVPTRCICTPAAEPPPVPMVIHSQPTYLLHQLLSFFFFCRLMS